MKKKWTRIGGALAAIGFLPATEAQAADPAGQATPDRPNIMTTSATATCRATAAAS